MLLFSSVLIVLSVWHRRGYGQEAEFPKSGQDCNPDRDILLLPNQVNELSFLQCHVTESDFGSSSGVWRAVPCPTDLVFSFQQQRCIPSAENDRPENAIQSITARGNVQPVPVDLGSAGMDLGSARPMQPQPVHPRATQMVWTHPQMPHPTQTWPQPVPLHPTNMWTQPQPTPWAQPMQPQTTHTWQPPRPQPQTPLTTSSWFPPQPNSVETQTASDYPSFMISRGQTFLPGPKEVYPGESCRSGELCLGGSFCNLDNGVCVCPEGTTDLNGECIKTLVIARPGETCSASWQCTGGSECVNGVCKCPPGLAQAGDQCARRVVNRPAYAGGTCIDGEPCYGGSTCNEQSGICECPSHLQRVGKYCRPLPGTRLPPIPIPTTAKMMVLVAAPGSSCAAGEICTGGSSCVGSFCVCPENTVKRDNQCVLHSPAVKPTFVAPEPVHELAPDPSRAVLSPQSHTPTQATSILEHTSTTFDSNKPKLAWSKRDNSAAANSDNLGPNFPFVAPPRQPSNIDTGQAGTVEKSMNIRVVPAEVQSNADLIRGGFPVTVPPNFNFRPGPPPEDVDFGAGAFPVTVPANFIIPHPALPDFAGGNGTAIITGPFNSIMPAPPVNPHDVLNSVSIIQQPVIPATLIPGAGGRGPTPVEANFMPSGPTAPAWPTQPTGHKVGTGTGQDYDYNYGDYGDYESYSESPATKHPWPLFDTTGPSLNGEIENIVVTPTPVLFQHSILPEHQSFHNNPVFPAQNPHGFHNVNHHQGFNGNGDSHVQPEALSAHGNGHVFPPPSGSNQMGSLDHSANRHIFPPSGDSQFGDAQMGSVDRGDQLTDGHAFPPPGEPHFVAGAQTGLAQQAANGHVFPPHGGSHLGGTQSGLGENVDTAVNEHPFAAHGEAQFVAGAQTGFVDHSAVQHPFPPHSGAQPEQVDHVHLPNHPVQSTQPGQPQHPQLQTWNGGDHGFTHSVHQGTFPTHNPAIANHGNFPHSGAPQFLNFPGLQHPNLQHGENVNVLPGHNSAFTNMQHLTHPAPAIPQDQGVTHPLHQPNPGVHNGFNPHNHMVQGIVPSVFSHGPASTLTHDSWQEGGMWTPPMISVEPDVWYASKDTARPFQPFTTRGLHRGGYQGPRATQPTESSATESSTEKRRTLYPGRPPWATKVKVKSGPLSVNKSSLHLSTTEVPLLPEGARPVLAAIPSTMATPSFLTSEPTVNVLTELPQGARPVLTANVSTVATPSFMTPLNPNAFRYPPPFPEALPPPAPHPIWKMNFLTTTTAAPVTDIIFTIPTSTAIPSTPAPSPSMPSVAPLPPRSLLVTEVPQLATFSPEIAKPLPESELNPYVPPEVIPEYVPPSVLPPGSRRVIPPFRETDLATPKPKQETSHGRTLYPASPPWATKATTTTLTTTTSPLHIVPEEQSHIVVSPIEIGNRDDSMITGVPITTVEETTSSEYDYYNYGGNPWIDPTDSSAPSDANPQNSWPAKPDVFLNPPKNIEITEQEANGGTILEQNPAVNLEANLQPAINPHGGGAVDLASSEHAPTKTTKTEVPTASTNSGTSTSSFTLKAFPDVFTAPGLNSLQGKVEPLMNLISQAENIGTSSMPLANNINTTVQNETPVESMLNSTRLPSSTVVTSTDPIRSTVIQEFAEVTKRLDSTIIPTLKSLQKSFKNYPSFSTSSRQPETGTSIATIEDTTVEEESYIDEVNATSATQLTPSRASLSTLAAMPILDLTFPKLPMGPRPTGPSRRETASTQHVPLALLPIHQLSTNRTVTGIDGDVSVKSAEPTATASEETLTFSTQVLQSQSNEEPSAVDTETSVEFNTTTTAYDYNSTTVIYTMMNESLSTTSGIMSNTSSPDDDITDYNIAETIFNAASEEIVETTVNGTFSTFITTLNSSVELIDELETSYENRVPSATSSSRRKRPDVFFPRKLPYRVPTALRPAINVYPFATMFVPTTEVPSTEGIASTEADMLSSVTSAPSTISTEGTFTSKATALTETASMVTNTSFAATLSIADNLTTEPPTKLSEIISTTEAILSTEATLSTEAITVFPEATPPTGATLSAEATLSTETTSVASLGSSSTVTAESDSTLAFDTTVTPGEDLSTLEIQTDGVSTSELKSSNETAFSTDNIEDFVSTLNASETKAVTNPGLAWLLPSFGQNKQATTSTTTTTTSPLSQLGLLKERLGKTTQQYYQERLWHTASNFSQLGKIINQLRRTAVANNLTTESSNTTLGQSTTEIPNIKPIKPSGTASTQFRHKRSHPIKRTQKTQSNQSESGSVANDLRARSTSHGNSIGRPIQSRISGSIDHGPASLNHVIEQPHQPGPMAKVGEPCGSNMDCSLGAYCKTDGPIPTCHCLSTHVAVELECLRIVYPGMSGCDSDAQCSAAFEGSRCVDNICVCPPGSMAQGQTCRRDEAGLFKDGLPARSRFARSLEAFGDGYPGGPCQAPFNTCLRGSQCKNDICTCSAGLVAINRQCQFIEVAPGRACLPQQICVGGSRCNNGICQCPLADALQDGTCLGWQNDNAGRACAAQEDCIGFTGCVNGVCHCISGTVEQPDGRCVFILFVPVGGTCDPAEACYGGSECINGKCECSDGSVVKAGICVQNPGGSCDKGQLCVDEATCQSGICQCRAGFKPMGLICTAIVHKPGESCQPAETCTGGSFCVSSVCQCQQGFVIESDTCVDTGALVPPGKSCAVAGQKCTGGSTCNPSSKICECPPGMEVKAEMCVPTSTDQGPSQACVAGTTRCSGGSACDDGLCRCPTGQTILPSGTCQSTTKPALPGQICGKNGLIADCTGESFCILDICQCTRQPPELIILNGRCVPGSRISYPGESCVQNQHCLGGSTCNTGSGICQCPAGFIILDKQCARDNFARPGDACSQSITCTGGSSCLNNICTCSTDQISISFVCVSKIVKPNGSCAPGQTCTGNSMCVQGRCSCQAGTVLSGETCVQSGKVPLGQTCNSDQMCGTGAVCQLGKCACQSGLLPATDGFSCIQSGKVPIGQACSLDQMCGTGAACQFAKCACQRGLVPAADGISCVQSTKVPLGQTCNSDQMCGTGAVCQLGKCACQSGLLPTVDGFSCVQGGKVPIGQACSLDQMCGTGAACQFAKCACQSGSVPAADGISCVQSAKVPLGQTCNSDQMCGTGAVCQAGTCACQTGLVPAPDNLSCFQQGSLPIGSTCRPDQVCDGGAICYLARCVCPPEKIQIGKACIYRYAPPGGKCQSGVTCVGGSTCQQDVCVCPSLSIVMGDMCQEQYVSPGENCSPTLQTCRNGSSCVNFVCQCPSGFSVRDHMCLADSKTPVNPGDRCSTLTVCTGLSTCVNDVCQCPTNYVIVNRICQPSGGNTAKPGQPCDASTLCTGNSVCQGGVCACTTGYVLLSDTCVSGTLPGGACSVSAPNCLGDSVCLNGYCVCTQDRVIIGGKCVPSIVTSLPGQACDANRICTNGSTCVTAVCQCPVGFQLVNNACIYPSGVDSALPGDRCSTQARCIGHSACIDGICKCPPGRIILKSSCELYLRYPGMECDFSAQMCTDGSVCRFSRCQCTDGTIQVGTVCISRTLLVSPLFPCTLNHICSGGSYCVDGVCRCPPHMTVIDQQCAEVGGQLPPGSQCTVSVQCTGSSICENGRCVCPINFALEAGICRQIGSSNQNCPGCGTQSISCPPGATVVQGHCLPSFLMSVHGGGCSGGELCIQGSACVNGVCVCPSGTLPFGTECRRAIVKRSLALPRDFNGDKSEGCNSSEATFSPPGGRCDEQQQCSGDSICRQGYCICPEAQMHVKNGRCMLPDQFEQPTANPGQTCYEDTICNGDSQCEFGICQCKPGFEAMGELCVRQGSFTASPGGGCTNGEQCQGGSYCDGSVCQCPQGSQASGAICASVSVPPLGGCANGETCTGGSVCDGVLCQCPPGTKVNGAMCERDVLPPASPGGFCEQSSQCTGGSHCEAGVCECPEGTELMVTGYCEEPTAAAIGAPCTESSVCSGGSLCYKGICECPAGQEPRGNQCGKLQSREVQPGEPCRAGDLCAGGSHCHDGQCQCPVGSVSNFGICEQVDFALESSTEGISAPGESCTELKDCKGGAYCRLGVCVCPLGTESLERKCVPSEIVARAGMRCKVGEQCAGGAYCVNGICTCPFGHVADKGICIAQEEKKPMDMKVVPTAPPNPAPPQNGRMPLPPGYLCIDGIDTCAGDAICSMGECRCPAGMHVYKEDCVPDSKLVIPGNVCRKHQVCVGGARCMNGVCVCAEGFHIVNNICAKDNFLLSHATRKTPEVVHCSRDRDCSGGSFCNQRKCTCFSGHELVDGRCQRKKPAVTAMPGEPCSNGQVCSGNSKCRSGFCICPLGTTATLNGCEIDGMVLPGSVVHTQSPGNLELQHVGPTTPSRKPQQSINVIDEHIEPGKAGPCPLPHDPHACMLPNCFCSPTGTEIPAGLSREDIPQFVVLTFDDAVNGKTVDIYKRLFDERFKNPNECEIKATFFVSHEWTNYDEVQTLSAAGHEMAANSITHESLVGKDLERWMKEFDGLRTIMTNFASIDPTRIVGVRSPQLALGGDLQYTMMSHAGFTYDNSMTANPGQESPPFWPQTLDYAVPWECQNSKCPEEPHPGIWEIPINQFYGYYLEELNNYKRGSMLSAAISQQESEESILELLWQNFNRAYNSNKAPYVLTLNSGFLTTVSEGSAFGALEKFLGEITSNDDVWVVTLDQLVQWLRNPVPKSELLTFTPFQCGEETRNFTRTPPACKAGNKCLYKTPDLLTGEHLFRTCSACPRKYPWLDNPDGGA